MAVPASLAVYLKPQMPGLILLGIASGLPLALTGSTLTMWLTEAGLDLKTIGLFAAVTAPYALKWLWSPLVDAVPLPFLTGPLGRRRAWMLLCQCLLPAGLVWIAFRNPADGAWAFAMAALVVATLSATFDLVFDAYRVELLSQEDQAAGAASAVLGYRLGMLLSGSGALLIADMDSPFAWQYAYLTMAVIFATCVLPIWWLGEPKSASAHDEESGEDSAAIYPPLPWFKVAAMLGVVVVLGYYSPAKGWLEGRRITLPVLYAMAAAAAVVVLALMRHLPASVRTSPGGVAIRRAVADPFRALLARKGWEMILLFVIAFKMGDAFLSAMNSPFYVAMGFSKTEVASIAKGFGFAGAISGAALAGMLVIRYGLFPILIVSAVLQMLSNLVYVWQAMVGYHLGWLAFTMSVENFCGGMASAAFVAYLSSLCNARFTATQYALLSSLASIGRLLLSTYSGMTVEAYGWQAFFIISTVVAIPGVILIFLLPRPEVKPVNPHPASAE